MKCPNCLERHHVHISSGFGYSQDIRECDSCETVWSFKDTKLVIIAAPRK